MAALIDFKSNEKKIIVIITENGIGNQIHLIKKAKIHFCVALIDLSIDIHVRCVKTPALCQLWQYIN